MVTVAKTYYFTQTVSDKTSDKKDEQNSGDIQLRDAKRGEWVR